jgi:dihydrolipoamide dehydrogenase
LLAHVASDQGEIAAENALGHAAVYDDKVIPSCVYTDPEFGAVGLTEEQVKQQGIKYKVGRFPLVANGKTLIINGHGMVKIIADEHYGEILGVHIIGPRATDLITEGALAIKLEATLDELIATIHAHPSIGEAVREAALAAQGRAIHIPNR